ncbi:hypothetical protein GYMLUDRAFT_255901 [Collybiopsis luxurians FD-317 M1]|nr:hypothetical protein GYMLUDRAFT_255901 [Collybiopsis luxurians FD-317 M1]
MSTGLPRVNIDMAMFHSYARSINGVPEQLLPEIRGLLVSLDQDLSSYSSDIFRLENQLLFLISQREKAQEQALLLRSLLAPIHRLPNELLSRIFDCACEDMTARRGISDAAFSLSAVCSRWRSLSLSHPKMWSNICLHYSYGSKLDAPFDLYIERSKQQLLTLQLGAYSPNQVFIQKLVACCSRWQNVTLTGSSSFMEALYALGLNFPALETLTIFGGTNLEIFTHAPKLRTLIAFGNLIPNRDVLGRITRLSYSLEYDDLHEIIELCPNLHTLITTDYHPLDDFSPSDLPTVIPTLTSLYITSNDDLWALCSMITPALTILDVEHQTRDDPFGYIASLRVEKFLEYSGCFLTTLVLTSSWEDTYVVALLQKLSALQRLTLCKRKNDGNSRSHPITKVFVDSLNIPQQSTPQQPKLPLVPKLHSLSLSLDDKSTDFDHKSFVEMIMSRWIPNEDYATAIGVACIRFVELRLHRHFDEAEYLPLIDLRKMGLCFILQ